MISKLVSYDFFQTKGLELEVTLFPMRINLVQICPNLRENRVV